MSDQFTHLNALRLRLSHERGYLARAKSEGEREIRTIWIAQIEREIENERRFIGLVETTSADMTDDELLSELSA